MRSRSGTIWRVVFLASAVACAGQLHAANQNCTWSGGAGPGNTNWSAAANWSAGGVPLLTNKVKLTFPQGIANKTATNDIGLVQVTDITFDDGGYTISGQPFLYIGGGGADFTMTANAGSNTITSQIQLNADLNIRLNAAGNVLELSGGVLQGQNGVKKLFTTGSSGGTVILSGAGNYGGGTTVASSTTLIVAADQALGVVASGTTVSNGATLGFDRGITYTVNEAISVQGTGAGNNNGAIQNISGNNTFSGTITMTGDTYFGSAAGNLNIAAGAGGVGGIVTGARNVTKVGPGSVTFSNTANSYTGTTTVLEGALIAGGNANSGSGVFGTSATAISVNAAAGASASLLTGGAFTIARNVTVGPGTGTDSLGGNTATSSSFTGTVALSNNVNLTQVPGGTVTFTSTSVISGGFAVTKTGEGTVRLNAANTYTGTTTINEGILELNRTGGAAFPGPGGVVIGDGTLGTGATRDILRLIQADQIPNTVTVTVNSSGQLDLNNQNETLGAATALTLSTGSASGALVTTGTGILTLGGNVSVTGVAADTFGASITGSTGTLALGAATRTFTVADTNAVADLSVSTVITGTAGLTKAGAGKMVLSGNDTYTGTTTVSGGVLDIQSATALGGTGAGNGTTVNAGATLQIEGGIAVGAEALTLNGTGTTSLPTLPAGTPGALESLSGTNSWAGTVALASNSSIGVTAGQLTVSGVVSGGSTLTKVGSGTLILTNTNTYTGTTTVSAGTLLVNGSQASSNVSVSNGATLGGTGTTGTITAANGSTVAPGSGGVGTLNSKDVTLNAGSTLAMEISAATAGNFDQLKVTGTVTLGGTLSITSLGGYAPASGDEIMLIDNDGVDAVSGTFAGLPDGAIITVGGQQLQISYFGGDGNDVVLYNPAFTITARETIDSDSNGKIDRIRIVTSRPLNDNFTSLTISVSGYTVSGYSTGATANDNEFFILLNEISYDTGATPGVQVTANTSLKHNGTNHRLPTDSAAVTSTDKAPPVLWDAEWLDTESSNHGVDGGDQIVLYFSENVTSNNAVAADIGLPVGTTATGDSLGTSTITNQPLSTMITITLAETAALPLLLTPGGVYNSANLTPGSPTGVFIANGAHLTDAVGLSAVTWGTTALQNSHAVDLRPGNPPVVAVAWGDTFGTAAKIWDMQIADYATSYKASDAGLTLSALNAGNVRARFDAACSISSPSGWTVAAVPGLSQFCMKMDPAASSGTNFIRDLSAGTQSLATGVYSGRSQPFNLQFTTPSQINAAAAAVPQSIVVTITVTQD